ncbi:RICIN domain-containing protein [Kitasatospora sp. NPDC058162]|uniref:RICIN domain-containing protein n=1 Tax=Kitasatospora sp. NPDC058162 TaxID=3346362 RepID=UPI0036D8ED0D
MRITQKAVATLLAAASLTGGAVLNCGTASAAVPVTASLQVQSDFNNLDEYLGGEVWTRDPNLTYQVWTLTPLGNGTFTIKGTHYGKCLAAAGPGKAVTQQNCDATNLAQRWIVEPSVDATAIASVKYLDYVLQANGQDQRVTTELSVGSQNQQWTAYEK